jgi:hypothetical protein
MTITVQAERRTALLASPSVFAMGEAMPVTIQGVDADGATLELALLSTSGTTLARCTAWTGDATAGFCGTLDLRTLAAEALFAGKRPDDRQPVIVTAGDKTRLWFVQVVELLNNPLRTPPSAPDPARHYLCTEEFSTLGTLSDDPMPQEIVYLLKAIRERLAP